jgi:tetratricopeptide (TPR) repeat protein
MVRNGILALAAIGSLLGLPSGDATSGDDPEGRIRTQLAVQTALQQGRDNLQRGNYQAAVYCLEKEIVRVDGNREYLNLLREAYRGYVRELHQANNHAEAKRYQERLRILDPGSHIEMNARHPSGAPTVAALASQTAATAPAPSRTAETPTPRPVTYTARPQMPEEHDPFADANSASPSQPQVRELLDRARHEFDHKSYVSANRLYEEANRLDAQATAPYRDFWAFCKLYAVTDAVNKAGGVPPSDAEKEVLAALALSASPQLERHGKDLLRQIHDRRVEVRHTPAHDRNWAEAETENFRIIHNQSRELAEQVARIAETTRATMTRKWFGEDAARWNPKCRIILYSSADHYARDTGKPADSPGHTTMKTEGERVVDRRIDLHCDVANMLTHVLPHETTHAVLSGRFGRHLVPRWVDEGIAVLSEPRDRIDRYLHSLPQYRAKRELFTSAQLVAMKDYPEARLISAFYVQSISLVEFLSSQKGGPQEFTRFVRDGLEKGFEASLREHYAIQDFGELEQRWSQYAFRDTAGTASLNGP